MAAAQLVQGKCIIGNTIFQSLRPELSQLAASGLKLCQRLVALARAQLN